VAVLSARSSLLARPAPARLVAALVYLAIALFQLYPAWTDPVHGVVGDWTHPDTLGNHWLYRWIAEELAGGGSILHNDRYYHPVGDAPFLAGNGSDAIPFALLGSWLAWPFSITAWSVLTMVLNGLAAYALARAAGAGPRGALVAGATLLFTPFVPRELSAGRFAQASLWGCGFFLASWLRLLDAPSARRGIVAGLWFGVAAFTYWYAGLWMAMAGALLWAFRPRPRALVAFVPAALAATVPPLLLFLRRWQEIPGVTEADFPHPIAVSYALTPSFPLWSGSGALSSVTLPLVVTLLAVAGWSRASRPLRLGVAAAAVLFYALCLGPEILAPDGTSTGIPGPYQLVYRWHGTLHRFWWPYRHVAPLALVLVPLVALGAERVVERIGARGGAALLVLALPIELYARGAAVDVEASWFEPPAAYRALAELEPGNVAELPLFHAIARTESSISYQWVHGRTLVNGHAMWVDRVRPGEWDAWIATQPLLDALVRFEQGELSGAWSLPAGAEPVDLAAVRYVTLNREYFPGELAPLMRHHAKMLTAWYGPPVVATGGVRVWDLSRRVGDGTWTFPAWDAPDDYVSASGLASLPADMIRAAGWRNWRRSVPPVAPTDAPVAEDPSRYADLPSMLRRKLERTQPATSDTAGADEP
jgi:hypothetical protein